ncbi:MAG: hypothetical protein KC419_26900 [Anaerolineales bacterium]|nr:hypothetical protein [Anaerolineales bacterium]
MQVVKWWQKFNSDLRKQVQWHAELVWLRLRYTEAKGAVKSINLLSRPAACGRVALCFQKETAVSHLYLGIPRTHLRLLQRMAADFGFSVEAQPPDTEIPSGVRLTAVFDLPWEKSFVAQVVNEQVFVQVRDGSGGSYFPQPSQSTNGENSWHLPDLPPPGLTRRPSWDDETIPKQFIAHEPDPQKWMLGRSAAGVPLHVTGSLNIYGRQDAAAAWLVHQVNHMLVMNHANLVVIDGTGDLVPQLKRKAAVTRLLGEQLTYIDIDSSALVTGFNPLAAVCGETEADTLQRWQTWFQGMHVPAQSLQLFTSAWQDSVRDLPALQKWLLQRERQGTDTAVSTLKAVLNRLIATRDVRNWLTWPVNQFEILPHGALLFACQAQNWQRQQLLQAVLLAVRQVPDVRLVLHGLPWASSGVGGYPKGVISNGPLLADSTVVLTQCHHKSVVELGRRFLFNEGRLVENLALLRRSESICVVENEIFFTTWSGSQAD